MTPHVKTVRALSIRYKSLSELRVAGDVAGDVAPCPLNSLQRSQLIWHSA